MFRSLPSSVSKSFGCIFSIILEVTFLSINFKFDPKVFVIFILYLVSLNTLLPLVFAGVK